MRLFVMVITLALACGAAAIAADPCCPSNDPCPTATCPSGPCPSICPSDPCPICPPQAQSVDQCLMCEFGLTQQQVCDLRNQGFSDNDIAMAGAIALKTCVPIDNVVACYCECRSWEAVASKYNVCFADVQAMASACICPKPAAVGAGPVPTSCCVVYGQTGNVLLSWYEAQNYYRRGYDWMDVALATNIAYYTGYPINTTLMDIRRGVLYEQIALMHAVPPSQAFNFTNYPYVRRSVYSSEMEAANMEKFAKYQVPTGTTMGAGPRCPCSVP